MEKAYSRSDRLLRKKFFQYLLPTMITYAALSLNEFVDSMFVSNLLDSKENIRLLRGVASKIENEYVLGMNSTRITIEAA